MGEGLKTMRVEAQRTPAAALRQDYVRLFLGPKKKLAPPWESVYRTPERKVMREPHVEVTKQYAAQGVGFDGIGRRPGDHVALELQFVAVMLGRQDAAADTVAEEFLDAHVLQWVPAFTQDVRTNATTDFWRACGGVLGALCELEAGVRSA